MGVGKFLKGLGKGFASFIPGGDAILGAAEGLGSILGKGSGADAASRREDEALQLQRDRLGLDRYDRERRLLGERMGNAMRASRMANRQPVQAQWGGPGSGLRGSTVRFHGGSANPLLVDDRAQQIAHDVMNDELTGQVTGTGGPPPISQPQKPGKGARILGAIGTGASILGGVGRAMGKGRGGSASTAAAPSNAILSSRPVGTGIMSTPAGAPNPAVASFRDRYFGDEGDPSVRVANMNAAMPWGTGGITSLEPRPGYELEDEMTRGY